jgi:hypothetical protein
VAALSHPALVFHRFRALADILDDVAAKFRRRRKDVPDSGVCSANSRLSPKRTPFVTQHVMNLLRAKVKG